MNPLWVGFFEVTGPPRSNAMLEGHAGAFLWIAAQAEDAAKLEIRAAYAMNDLGLTVVSSEHLQEAVDENDLSAEVWELIPEARRNVESVVCGTWYRFKNHDA
jgi:hypothetical protein